MTKTRRRSGTPLNLRVPELVRDLLVRLRDEIEAQDEERPSEPKLVAALIASADAEYAISALRQYRRILRESTEE